MIDPVTYDWSKFEIVFYYDQPKETVFRAWATSSGLESFFIEHDVDLLWRSGSRIGLDLELYYEDLREQLDFARIWGDSAFDGQTVQRDHVLADGDVVEIHM